MGKIPDLARGSRTAGQFEKNAANVVRDPFFVEDSLKVFVVRRSLPFSICCLLASQITLAHENQPYFELGLGRSLGSGELLHGAANSAGTPRYDVGNATVRSAAVGYQFISGLRVELDFRDRNISISDEQVVASRSQSAFTGAAQEQFDVRGTMNSTSRMLSVAYVGELIKPDWKAYLKLGAGESKNRSQAAIDIQPTLTALGRDDSIDYLKGSNREFAWLAGAGVHVHLQDKVEIGFDYQYSNLGDASTRPSEFGDVLEYDRLAVHELSIKLRFHF
ncbi:MAG: outer membrane protein [Pseudomonadales bacterium]